MVLLSLEEGLGWGRGSDSVGEEIAQGAAGGKRVCPGSSEPQKNVPFLEDVVIISQAIFLYEE